MNNKLKDKQDELSKFVSREVYLCQSMLVEELLKNETFEYDDIVNGIYTMQEMKDNGFDNDEIPRPKEIMEWWACSDWLLDKLEAQGEPVLKTGFGDWWGRCSFGQAIHLDSIIEKIFDDMSR